MDLAAVTHLAERLLERNPDPVVRLRLLRDVLQASPMEPPLADARGQRDGNRWVRELIETQHTDGGWGRFHSQDTKSRQRVPTTEEAVRRAVTLGMELTDPLLQRTAGHITAILNDAVAFPDPPEANACWPASTHLFAAGTLARFDPWSPVLDGAVEFWSTMLKRAFLSGYYSAEEEHQAWRERTGLKAFRGHLHLGQQYHLALLGPRARDLPADAERAFVSWLWRRPEGVGYLGVPLHAPPVDVRNSALGRWLASLELLSFFPTAHLLVPDALEWVWGQRNAAGLWDFGGRGGDEPSFRLSESWRPKGARETDHSTRVLTLLSRYLPA